MTLRTAFTELVGVEIPIVLAPMGGIAGGALAAAVSNGGGLGLVGCGREDRVFQDRELDLVARLTDKPWGVGFQSWSTSRESVEAALASGPRAVMLSFGDPRPLAGPVQEAGVLLIVQVTDLAEARVALEVGADVIVAQGAEAGGHSGGGATLPFVPIVVDLVAPVPVLASGGIADGRGIAAALCLGASGALLGTRFEATSEAILDPEYVKAILDGHGADTERSRVLDIARRAPWPDRYLARTLRNDYLERWRGREAELEADAAAKDEYEAGAAAGDLSVIPVWASEAIDLVDSISPAADLVAELGRDAETALTRAGKTIAAPRHA